MRSKNHHLVMQGGSYNLRYRIPADVLHCYSQRKGPAVFEPLKVKDVQLARRLRDERLAALNREWDAFRIKLGAATRKPGEAFASYEGWALAVRKERADAGDFNAAMDARLDAIELNATAAGQVDPWDRDAVHDAMDDNPEARTIALATDIAEGKVKSIRQMADEWLAMKSHLNSSTLYTYRKAIDVLLKTFSTVEEIDKRKARNFAHGLMSGEGARNRHTVGQYTIAYRGVWEHVDRDPAIWSLKGMQSETATVRIDPWTDAEYLRLLAYAESKGLRDMVLAIRIAAHTGAAASGVASAELVDEGEGCFSIALTETKKEHRSRKIPCHPAILEDVREWCGKGGLTSQRKRHDAKSLSRKFGRLKDGLGFGREKVLHSFRHAVANKLENARVMDREVKRLLGHYIPDITFGIYSAQGLGFDALDKVVRLIEWPEQVQRLDA
jgi:integrase